MKEHYRRGGLGDGKCKKFLIQIHEETLSPIRASREKWAADIDTVYDIILDGTKKAREITNTTLGRVESAMRVDYFMDRVISGALLLMSEFVKYIEPVFVKPFHKNGNILIH